MVKFHEVDIANFDIGLNISEQNVMFRDIKSRKVYDYLVKELRKLFVLQISDNQTVFQFTEKQITETYI